MKIVFMGSAEFGIPALEMLLGRHEVAAVVSTPARPKGRGRKLYDSPVTEYVKGLPSPPRVLTPESLEDPAFIGEMRSIGADLFVVVAFRILPKAVFSLPKFGTVNLHASLLPLYRGAAPIQRAIEAGAVETGVTVFRIDEGIDTGEVLIQKTAPIGREETAPELYGRLSTLGVDALAEAIDGLASESITPVIQGDDEEAPLAPKLTKKEGRLNWKLPARTLFNKIRAYKPFPGTYIYIDEKRIGVEWAIPDGGGGTNPPPPPGTVLIAEGDYIDVQCGAGALRLIRVKPAGRPEMGVRAFLAGHKVVEGTRLE